MSFLDDPTGRLQIRERQVCRQTHTCIVIGFGGRVVIPRVCLYGPHGWTAGLGVETAVSDHGFRPRQPRLGTAGLGHTAAVRDRGFRIDSRGWTAAVGLTAAVEDRGYGLDSRG